MADIIILGLKDKSYRSRTGKVCHFIVKVYKNCKKIFEALFWAISF